MKGLSCYAWGFGGVSGMASLFSDEMIYGFQDLICSNYSLSTGLKLQTSESLFVMRIFQMIRFGITPPLEFSMYLLIIGWSRGQEDMWRSKFGYHVRGFPYLYIPFQVWNNLFLNKSRVGENGLAKVATIWWLIWKARNVTVFYHIPVDLHKLIDATSYLQQGFLFANSIQAQDLRRFPPHPPPIVLWQPLYLD
ncbi:hypothetical protein M9H77_23093 [Catharanthus roseus]|uniref:Uncharacterized protein n=1 Tax=Catharanthus roseus TaxID=4058 RepID=A0ACC0AU22_CATRO|nr:hypothetical protein M9H77_23093 [Catharanthus roseus]